MVINLSLKGNKTFSMTAVAAPPDGKSHTMTGTWSQTGNKVTMVAKTEDGKPATGKDKNQTLTVAPNGKSLTLDMPGGTDQGKLVFTR
jgi:hypothetical protein